MPKKTVSHYERNAEESFLIVKQMIELEEQIRKATVELAGVTIKAYNQQVWKDYLGDDQAEWKALLSVPEIFRTRSEMAKLMFMYDKLVNQFGFNAEDLSKISVKKLIKIATLSDASNEADDLVAKASTLTSIDWNDEVRKLDDKPTPDDCAHAGMVKEERCPRCGFKHKLEEPNAHEE